MPGTLNACQRARYAPFVEALTVPGRADMGRVAWERARCVETGRYAGNPDE